MIDLGYLYTVRPWAHLGDALEPRQYISAVGLFCLGAILGLERICTLQVTQPAPRAQSSRICGCRGSHPGRSNRIARRSLRRCHQA